MATYEHDGLLTYKDGAGNKYLLYPITRRACIDGMEDIDAHLKDLTGNPHQITPALIGAAPAGYGYGEAVKLLSFSNDTNGSLLEAALDNVIAGMKDGEIMQVSILDYPHMSGATFYGSICRHTADYAMVNVYSYSTTAAVKIKEKGAWSPWAWENPPTELGSEYRTTECWQGKAVYTAIIECGALPSNARKDIAHGISCTKILRCTGTTSQGLALPYIYGSDRAEIAATTSAVVLTTNSTSYTAYTVCVQLWYTKD